MVFMVNYCNSIKGVLVRVCSWTGWVQNSLFGKFDEQFLPSREHYLLDDTHSVDCFKDMSGIKILSQLLDSSLVKHVNSVLRVFEHGLVSSARHAEQEMLNYLFWPEIKGFSMFHKVDQLLQVALSDEWLLFFVKFLNHVRLTLFLRLVGKRRKALYFACRTVFIPLRDSRHQSVHSLTHLRFELLGFSYFYRMHLFSVCIRSIRVHSL